jgi:NAD-dependent DNA ligase
MSFDLPQLTHFAAVLQLDLATPVLRTLFDADKLESPVSFFELTAPELKDLQLGVPAASFVSKCNAKRKQPLDVVLHAVGLEERLARAIAAGAADLDEVRALGAEEVAKRATVPVAKARLVVKQLKALGAVLDGLDAELQIKPVKQKK